MIRQHRWFTVNPREVLEFVRANSVNMPEDASYVNADFQWESGQFRIMIRSKEFEVVGELEAAPQFDLLKK